MSAWILYVLWHSYTFTTKMNLAKPFTGCERGECPWMKSLLQRHVFPYCNVLLLSRITKNWIECVAYIQLLTLALPVFGLGTLIFVHFIVPIRIPVLGSWIWVLMYVCVVPHWFGKCGIFHTFLQSKCLCLFCIWSSLNC